MRWQGNRESDNVEDRRDEGGSSLGGGGGGGFGFGGRSIGIGTVAIALIAGWIFGINPLTMLGMLSGNGGGSSNGGYTQQVQAPQGPARAPPANDQSAAFVSTVLASTEDVWGQLLANDRTANGTGYQAPKLVLFRGATVTACGEGESAMGPFYCPQDHKVYIDLDFFDTLSQKLGAPGQFAQAYVVAHEVGHHVQTLLGIMQKADQARAQGSSATSNAISVRIELQADCFAGVWGYHAQQTKHWMDPGDAESALNAASQIGDDTLQRKSRGTVVPESFTHGTSAQRVAWFRRGFDSGDMNQCDTFKSQNP